MIVKEEIKGCKLWNVPLGRLFKHSDRFFIKTCTCCLRGCEGSINCLDVKSGLYTYIDDFAFVEYFPDAFISVGEGNA